MSEHIFSLSDISVSDGSPVVSVNNSDSFFGLIKGSQLFIAGKLPATIEDHDTTARTITLRENWSQGDLSNVAATVVPIGAVSTLLQALENNRAAYQAFLENAGGGGSGNGGEISWSVIIDPPPTATQWPTWTQVQGDINEVLPETAIRWPHLSEVTGTLGESQLPEVAVKAPQLKALEDAEGRRGLSQSPAHFNHEHGAFNHVHHDLLEKSASELPPQYPPIKAPALHFDTTQKRLHAQFSSSDVTDTLELNNYLDRRYFFVVNQPLYIQLRTPYTGRLSYRVYKWDAPDTAIPGIASAPVGEWETVIVDVVDFQQFGTDGSGNYFYGIIDWISLEDIGVFVKLEKNYFLYNSGMGTSNAYIPTLGSVTRNTGTLDNPFVECFLRPDYVWESVDLTPSVPFSISSGWTQQSERVYIASNVTDGEDDVELLSSSITPNLSLTWGVLCRSLEGNLSTTVENDPLSYMRTEGTSVFSIPGKRVGLKRAYGTLNAKVEILFIKQTIVDPDSYVD